MAEITGQTMADLLEGLTKDYAGARERRLERYETGLGELRKVADLFGPGYMAGQETAAIRGAEQQLIGRGLGGTTRPFATAAGMKAQFRDVRQQARAGAMTNIANFMTNFRDVYPEAGILAHLATGGFGGLFQERLAEAPGGVLGPTLYGVASRNSGGGGGGGGASQTFESMFGETGASRITRNLSLPSSPFTNMSGDISGINTYSTLGEALAAHEQFIKDTEMSRPPTPYYEAGGGWKDWEETGGKLMPPGTTYAKRGNRTWAEYPKGMDLSGVPHVAGTRGTWV